MIKLKWWKKDELFFLILIFNDEVDDLLNVSMVIVYINLYDCVGYLMECLLIWKYCFCKM